MIDNQKVSRKRSGCGCKTSGRMQSSICLLGRQCEEYASMHTQVLGRRTNIKGGLIRRRPMLFSVEPAGEIS